MASNVTRDHHNLRRNLNLNDNYISNDGGDEGIRVDDAGLVGIGIAIPTATLEVQNSSNSGEIAFKVDNNDVDKHAIKVEASNTTVNVIDIDATAATTADIINISTLNTTTGSVLSAITVYPVPDGATSHIIHLFNNNAGVGDQTSRGIYLDYNKAAITASGKTANVTGIHIDIDDNVTNVGTVNMTGLDIAVDFANAGDGTTTTTGLNVAVAGADTNYAAIFAGGNVGIGVTDPDVTLEVLSTSAQLKLSYDTNDYFRIAVGSDGHTTMVNNAGVAANINIEPKNDLNIKADTVKLANGDDTYGYLAMDTATGQLDIQNGAGNAVVVIDDGDRNLYFYDKGGEYIASDGTDLTIVSGTSIKLEAPLKIKEASAAVADTDTYGQIWVKNEDPEELYFTTGGGDDIQITSGTSLAGGGGSARSVAGDTDNALISWVTSDNTFAAEANLTFDGTDLIIASTGKLAVGDNATYIHQSSDTHLAVVADATITLDAGTDIILDADGDQVSMKFGGATGQIDFSNENSGDGVIRQMVNAKDLVIQQFDGDEVARFTDGGDLKITNTVYFAAETANTIADGATEEIDWNVSQKQKVTITGTGITCNFADPAGPCNVVLKVVQGDGSDVIATWDTAIKWAGGAAPTLSTGNGEIDILSFYWDGSNYFGVASLDFATP